MDDRTTELGQSEQDPFSHDPQLEADAGVSRVRNDSDFLNLPEGSQYFSPDNKRRTKHYEVRDDADFMRVPEGAPYMGPDGISRTKPNYGDIGFTAQALHDMALTPEAKTEALRRSYGDKVKTDEAGPYVQEEDGLIRRPGIRSFGSAMGTAAAETLPAIGMVGGGLLGGGGGALAGSAIPVAGTIAGGAAGATAGAVGGAMAGRQANNVILSLMGIHQPVLDQIASMGREGAYTAGGEAVGRGVGKVAQWAKGPSKEGRGLPNDFTEGLPGAETPTPTKDFATRRQQIAEDLGGTLESMGITPEKGPKIGIGKFSYQTPGVRSLLGVNDEGLARLMSTQESGFKVGPSAAFPDAPMLTKLEQLDQMFNKEGGGRFQKSAREGYERISKDIMEDPQIGAFVKEPLTRSTETVSYKEAGEKAVKAAQVKMALEDAKLADAVAQGPEKWAQTYITNVDAARNLAKEGIAQIGRDADAAMQNMATHTGSSDLVNNIATSFRSYNSAVRAKASSYYDMWDRAAGAKPIDVTGLQQDAERFFDAMPADLAGKYPMEIRLLRRLAAPVDEESSSMLKKLGGDDEAIAMAKKLGAVAPEEEKAITMTAGELHQLRSWMRHGINYDDLMSDMSQGAMKHFEGKVNGVIQALPESQLLNSADAFYKETIPYLNNEMIKSTMRALKGGTGIDPEAAANIFFKFGRAEDVNEARKVLGPNLWNAVEAAHIQSLLNKSRDFNGVDAKRFATAILDDHRKGMLNLGYSGGKAQELVRLGEEIQRLDGKIYINALDTDSIPTILNKARAKTLDDARVAAVDPLRAFDDAAKEMKVAAATKREASPIHTLFGEGMSYKGELAARNILSSEDNIIAASNYFGRDSATFNELRKVFVRDFLQREYAEIGQMRPELSKKKIMTDRVQQLMFPGWTLQAMKTLAKDTEFLFGAATVGRGSDVGASLAGSSRVFNPPNILPGLGRFAKFPGIQFINRIILGKYYGALMEGVSNPAFSAWLTKSLESGNPAQKEAAKNVLNDRLKTSPWLGRAAGQYMAQPNPEEPTQDQYAQ